jgi:hypothetical protein
MRQQNAAGLFAQRQPGCWVDDHDRRTVHYWDEKNFSLCEGVKQPLRVLRTAERVRRRERIAGQCQKTEETTTWSWATTLTKAQLSSRGLWRYGRARWDIENDCFNSLATDWGLDRVRGEPSFCAAERFLLVAGKCSERSRCSLLNPKTGTARRLLRHHLAKSYQFMEPLREHPSC